MKISKLVNQLCIDISGRPINVKSAPPKEVKIRDV